MNLTEEQKKIIEASKKDFVSWMQKILELDDPMIELSLLLCAHAQLSWGCISISHDVAQSIVNHMQKLIEQKYAKNKRG